MLLRKSDYILKEHERVIEELKLKADANNTPENNNGWISVKDRLPDKSGSYLVIGKSGGATVTRWYMPNKYYPSGHFGGNSSGYIRYWMPRPQPPKGE